jgi:tetratricopeptide (TPR) repeat protein
VSAGDWQARVDALWDAFDRHSAPAFRAAMAALAAERPPGDPLALFETASAHDATDQEAEAAAAYERALAAGLSGETRRRAVVQYASTLRNLGRPEEGAALLRAEKAAASDAYDGAIDAFLALCLTDAGRAPEAVALLVRALAGEGLPYRRSLLAYADELERRQAPGAG